MLSQDLSNYIQKVKRDKADTYNDSARLLENLLTQQQEDPLMLVISRIDPITLRLTGIFWMNSKQQLLFSKYNDVILHDNIALTNRYKWPLSLFIVVDCNNKIRLLAQAFVQDETECSYVWLIQYLKKTSIIPHVHWSKTNISGSRYVPDMYPICVVLMQKIGYPICVRYV
ncbi:unnamed protein product [Rhizophagus irregularis]|nr:unnamed protein product [Rhizophagus irregularis]